MVCRPSWSAWAAAANPVLRGAHRLLDLRIGAAPAEVAAQVFLELVVAGVRQLGQEGPRHHDEAGRAVATLEGLALPEGGPNGVVLPHPLQGQHLHPLRPRRSDQAGAEREPIHHDRAGAADSHSAPLPDARQVQAPEGVEQHLLLAHRQPDRAAVDAN